MIDTEWEDITSDTVASVAQDGYSEGKRLEFKRQQDPSSQGHQKSTVSEIVSFANSRGGDLIIGIADEDGRAGGLWPVDYDDPDETVLRWVNIIKRNTDPEIPQQSLDIKPLYIGAEYSNLVDEDAPEQTGSILFIRVQRSWRTPHRELFSNQFYERSAGGKDPLDTGSIRRSMVQDRLFLEQAKEFRDDRLSAIQANDVAVPLDKSRAVVLHIMSRNSFSPGSVIDPSTANPNITEDVPLMLHPRAGNWGWTRYTEDGFINAYGPNDGEFDSYVHSFRDGVIESITTRSFEQDPTQYINSGHIRNCIEEVLEMNLGYLLNQGGQFPVHIFLSMVGAKGLPVCTLRESQREPDLLETVHRDVSRPPAARVETPEYDIDEVINSLLDGLYQASGRAQETRIQ